MIDKFRSDLEKFMNKWGLELQENDSEVMLYASETVLCSVGLAMNPFGYTNYPEDEENE